MEQNTEEQQRASVNRGKDNFKILLNIFTIVLLILLYRSLFVTHDGNHWLYGIGAFYWIIRLAVIHRREKKAYDMGITYYDYLVHRKKELEDKLNND